MSSEKSKLIPFTKELEETIEADAKRCQRSFVRQVVAVLMTYYSVNDVEVKKLNSSKDLPHFTIDLTDKKKKSA